MADRKIGCLSIFLFVALCASMFINFLWPRAASNPPVSSLPNLPNLGPIGDIPLFEATLGVILVVGFIYWLVAQRNAPATRAIAPAGSPAA